jgi:nitrogen fixation/metabolism regulation signal transduction histidine kinase
MILWFYTETYIENQNQRTLIRNLSSDIDILGNNLLKHFGGVIDSTSLIKNLTLNDARNISESSGRDFNVYFYDSLIVSSRPEMYQTELVSRYISSNAYLQLFILGKNFYYENATIGNFPYLVGYVPITSSYGKTIGVLSVPVIYKDSLTERDLAQSLAFIFGGYILVFFMILVIGYYLSKIISTPIRNLTNATRNIISGDLDTQIPITGQDEISELIISFNKMTTELKENQKELAKAEREAAWKEMARQVAHEIKNPLTPMKLSVQHLQRINKDKAENFNEIFNRVTKTLLEQIDTLTKIVSGFSHFAKMPDRNIGKCNIHEIITQAINLLKEEKAIDFEVKFCDNVKMIDGDSEELRRVFINIIRNSIQAINAKETKNGKISIATVCSGKQILIKIHDNGIGIPSDIIPKIFDVNFSTKKEGMGIGLKISRKTIRDFGGDIRISSIENQGTTVEITL